VQATGDVIAMQDVGLVRDGATLLDRIDWTVDHDQRWVILGPNGAGKTTALRVASTRLFPTRGTVDILGERMGAVDVFELRPRIGLSSAALGERIPASEKAKDVVLTASYGGGASDTTSGTTSALTPCSHKSGALTSRIAPTARCRKVNASGCRSPER
jgi:ABC-type molybdenum transport system ATPase subunit/photorepair protein PhrA